MMEQPAPLILIVGAADTGRAPMAVALLRRLLNRRGLGWEVASAGIVGHDESPAQPEARDAMSVLGLDLRDHVARSLDDELVAAARLLLAIDSGVARVLRGRYPGATTVALGELSGSRRDIPDPFRMQVGAWVHYGQEIEAMLSAGLPQLTALIDGVAQLYEQPEPAADAQVALPEQPAAPAAISPTAERTTALERAARMLALLAEAPGVIDWAGARTQLEADLGRVAAEPLVPADLAPAYVAILLAMLGLTPTAPSPRQTAAMADAVARLRQPIDQPALTAISNLLPRWAGM